MACGLGSCSAGGKLPVMAFCNALRSAPYFCFSLAYHQHQPCCCELAYNSLHSEWACGTDIHRHCA